MRKVRNIIQIDEELCNGCGQCVLDCAEGALQVIDGKAKLVGEIYCDGLGACLSGCPTGALTVTQREADDFDEKAVEDLLKSQGKPLPPPQDHAHAHGGHHDHHHGHGHGHHHGHHHGQGHPHHGHGPGAGGCPSLVNASLKPAEPAPLACGCPGSSATALQPGAAPVGGPAVSTLGHWPLKLTLLAPQAPFLKNADLVLLADCTAAALPDLHTRVLPGKAVAMACPKLDDASAHIQKLAQVLAVSQPKTLTVAIMEVPCCRGLQFIAQEAVKAAGLDLPVQTMVVARDGRVLEDPFARVGLA